MVYDWVGRLSGDLVIVLEPGGFLRYCAPTVAEVLGHDPAALRGHEWWDLVHPEDVASTHRVIDGAVDRGGSRGTLRLHHADGRWRWFALQLRRSDGGAAWEYLLTGLVRDDTDQRVREDDLRTRAEELFTLASVDVLTGLPNRRQLAQTCTVAWREAARRREPLSLLVIDVDEFKAYNDDHGHQAGDQCLMAVAAVLPPAMMRPGDSCGRYGGEEFVAVLPNTDQRGAAKVAETIRAAVQGLGLGHRRGPFGVVTVQRRGSHL